MTKILFISSSCTILQLTFLKEPFSSKSIPFFVANLFASVLVVGEYPITWDNLQSSTCLIWNRFVTFYTSPIFQMFKKRYNMVGRTIPWRHFNRPDGALFSVKAAVSKASL